jgi:hypothetical protein
MTKRLFGDDEHAPQLIGTGRRRQGLSRSSTPAATAKSAIARPATIYVVDGIIDCSASDPYTFGFLIQSER